MHLFPATHLRICGYLSTFFTHTPVWESPPTHPPPAEDDTLLVIGLKLSWTRRGYFSAILWQICRNSSNSIWVISSYNMTMNDKIHLSFTRKHNSKLNIGLHMFKIWQKYCQFQFNLKINCNSVWMTFRQTLKYNYMHN